MKLFNIHMMRLGSASIFIAGYFAAGCGFAEQLWPNSRYFKGVEDRIDQADLIVVAEAIIIGKLAKREGDPSPVDVQLDVKKVIKGCHTNDVIIYPAVLYQYGFPPFMKVKTPTFSTKDEVAVQMVKHIPFWSFEKKENVVVFFVRKEQEIRPYCVYWDGFFEGGTASIPLIYDAEQTRIEQQTVAHIEAFLSSNQEEMINQYAIRAILKSDMTWIEICTMLSKHIDALGTPYAAGAVAAHCRFRQIKGDDLEIGVELLRSIFVTLSDEPTKVSFLARIKRNYPELYSQIEKGVIAPR